MSNRPSFASVSVGDASPPLVCGPLTRTQFVRYAGASHDFNPNHHDEVYAKASGNKAVFGMGMLAGGYCAGNGLIDCEFSAVNQNGEVIIRGDATAALPR
jgi:acyl dehydratase